MTTQQFVGRELLDDMPEGDLTTDALGCKNTGRARLVAKQDLVLSGTEEFQQAFHILNPKTQFRWAFKDGDWISKGQEICDLQGPLDVLLKGERTALNFLGHLSGVATLTRTYVGKTKGTKAKICDTRKTLPGMRTLEKKAVRDGGGTNHRMNLSSGILIKENHIRSAGGIERAVALIRTRYPRNEVEVEVSNLKELEQALQCRVEKVLLDNMTLEEMTEAVRLVGNRCLIEASGNMSLDRIEAVAHLGVDIISVGRLTHSAPWADVTMLFDIKEEDKS